MIDKFVALRITVFVRKVHQKEKKSNHLSPQTASPGLTRAAAGHRIGLDLH